LLLKFSRTFVLSHGATSVDFKNLHALGSNHFHLFLFVAVLGYVAFAYEHVLLTNFGHHAILMFFFLYLLTVNSS
jgi:hypothetical protein